MHICIVEYKIYQNILYDTANCTPLGLGKVVLGIIGVKTCAFTSNIYIYLFIGVVLFHWVFHQSVPLVPKVLTHPQIKLDRSSCRQSVISLKGS